MKYLYENFDELTESLGPIRVIEKVVDQLLRILLTQTDITEGSGIADHFILP